MSAAVGNNNA